ncbi:unnamed protein product, partial [Adineta ricciae]
MSSSLTYFNNETFLDGTGRGKLFRQVQFACQSNKTEPCAPMLTNPEEKTKKKKHHRKAEVVCVDVQLPLPAMIERNAPVFILCEQFPEKYISQTSLPVLHWSKYHGRNISFYLKDIGYFSTADRSDANRCREDFRYLKRLIYDIDDTRQLKQLNIEFDLNIGSAYLNPAEPSTSLDALLWWISRHKTTVVNKKGRFIFDFVGWRGTIRKIMSSLFNQETDWRIAVIRYRGAHFFHVVHTETELAIEFGQTPIEKRMCYWGHKFEDYLCSETPPLFPSPKKLFSLVNLATLGVHTLLYGSEIDACTKDSIIDDESDDLQTTLNSTSINSKLKKKRTFVEIKVVYAENMLELHTSTARKYAKWWSQCFLTGIEQILLGFRNEYGIVRQIHPLLIKDIETRARTWSSSSFLAFLSEFCAFVRKTITKDYFDDDQHTDHLRGLDDETFSNYAKSNRTTRIYCSEATRYFLSQLSAYKHLSQFYSVLNVDQPLTIQNPADDNSSVTVTCFGAGHCPGSLMLLFEGLHGTVLYTGDFRLYSHQSNRHRVILSKKRIDSLYIDMTFFEPSIRQLPQREQACGKLIDFIQQYQDRPFYLKTSARVGYEYIYMSLYQHFATPIHVSIEQYHLYDCLPQVQQALTTDGQ